MKYVNSSIIHGGGMQKQEDESLDGLIAAIDPIVTEIDQNAESNRAILMIAARDIPGTDEMQTYVSDVGDLGIVQEALYIELLAQLENNNTDLFQALREV